MLNTAFFNLFLLKTIVCINKGKIQEILKLIISFIANVQKYDSQQFNNHFKYLRWTAWQKYSYSNSL